MSPATADSKQLEHKAATVGRVLKAGRLALFCEEYIFHFPSLWTCTFARAEVSALFRGC